MSGDRLRVVIIGDRQEASPCDTYRGGILVEPLARHGVDLEYASPTVATEAAVGEGEFVRLQDEAIERVRTAAAAAQVIVFRRAYTTMMLCLACDFATAVPAEATSHVRATRHPLAAAPSMAARALFDEIEHDAAFARDHAIVYETDDDLLQVDADNGIGRSVAHELDLIERMLHRSDLVTTTTPVLAAHFEGLTSEVRVVRNAVDPGWYAPDPGSPSAGRSDTRARLLFYGSAGRMRDYAICAPAVNALRRSAVRRVWLGAPDIETREARDQFDEVHGFVIGTEAFARTLAGLHPDIGLAPLRGSSFDRAKSELHWIEYAMAGAVTVASGLPGGGPYDVIRNGVDGIVIDRADHWEPTLRRLVGSRNLREEMAGRARERVLREYTVEARADDWAAAFRLAFEHRGRGRAADVPSARARSAGVPPDEVVHKAAEPSSAPAALDVALAGSDPAELLHAYVAALAFAATRPLRIRVGRNGSATAASAPPGEGWVVVDSAGAPDVQLDVRFGLPFPDASADEIDVLFALDVDPAVEPVLLVEAARVIRPEGRVRIRARDRTASIARNRLLELQGIVVLGEEARLPLHDRASLAAALADAGLNAIGEEPAPDGEFVLVAAR